MKAGLSYSIRSLTRNFRRSSVLMFGIIISISIISGIMFYSDSTNESLVAASISDVELDISVEVGNIDLEEILDIQEFIDIELSDLINGSNLIAGTTPFFPILGGGLVSGDPDFEIEFGFSLNSNLNYSSTYIFGIQEDYLQNQNLFDFGDNVDFQLNTGEILLSDELQSSLDLGPIGTSVNISLAPELNFAREVTSGSLPEIEIERTFFYEYAGEISFNNEVVQGSMDAFYDLDDDLPSQFINIISGSANAIVMNYDDYFDLIGSNENLISFNSIHIVLDREGFSNDIDTLLIQLGQINNRLQTFYPSVTVNNFLTNALNDAYDELNSIKLALIYFALPGLFLGAYITKYAMDLNIKERKREINLLRTKAATKGQIASIIIGESSIISLFGFLLGVALGYLLSFVTANSLSSDPGTVSIQISQTSVAIIIGIGISIAGTAGYLSTKQLLDLDIKSGLNTKTETSEFWKRYKIDFILLIGVGAIVVMNLLDFNPIPDFAATLYSFLAPIFTWLGLTLLFMRVFSGALIKYNKLLITVFRRLYGDLSNIIVKNILFRNVKISNIIVLLSLTIS
ncbi:MAG: FtsX-like permease family protein, partial [Candidatus Heimdallarchaeota archaeon]|nr:FtsX-like permease family protein [Candidatus Heimdallarchaeota archaeon]